MDSVEIVVNNELKRVNGIYYISNNNYYFLYTDNTRDENSYVILNIVKVLQEVSSTPNGQVPTGNLIGISISDDQEWKNVQHDISNIIDDKQNKKKSAVRYLEICLLKQLIIKGSRIFRLKEEIFNRSLNQSGNSGNNGLILDYKNQYYEATDKIRLLEEEVKNLKDKLNQIKNIIE